MMCLCEKRARRGREEGEKRARRGREEGEKQQEVAGKLNIKKNDK
jgi:hypothetical protein